MQSNITGKDCQVTNKPTIYLDNAASTKINNEVLETYIKALKNTYANASSKHEAGLQAKIQTDKARNTIAKYLKCKGSEIIFTGSGTESNNIAIMGAVKANKRSGNHILTSIIEHPSVLECFKQLEKEGFEVTYLEVNQDGQIIIDDFKAAIKQNTIFASIMYVNNITGNIQPISEIGKICKNKNIIFHTDACQAQQFEPINIKELNCDLLTLNSSKIHGPKGVGALYINQKIKISPIIYGGGQEKELRSGTINTPAIIAMAKAFEIIQTNKEKNIQQLQKLKSFFVEKLKTQIPEAKINGTNTTPHIICITIDSPNSHQLPLLLSEQNIFISSSSACKAGSTTISSTLKSMGLTNKQNSNSMRFSLSINTTKDELKTTIETLKTIIKL